MPLDEEHVQTDKGSQLSSNTKSPNLKDIRTYIARGHMIG